MANLNITEVEGFDQLNAQFKRFRDSVKRSEVLKLMRRLARPVVLAYRRNLPVDQGALRKGTTIRTLPARKSGGNPVIAIYPGKSRKNDPFYRHMVVAKGTKLNGRGKGSRRGRNTVVPIARDKTLSGLESGLVQQATDKGAEFAQKQIDRLSRL